MERLCLVVLGFAIGCAGSAGLPPEVVPAAPASPSPTASAEAAPPPGGGWRSKEGPPILTMREIAAGSDVTCALYDARRDGPSEPGQRAEGRVVRCRGRHVDEASAATFVPVLDDATQISVGGLGACAVRADRTVWCWDYYASGVPDRLGPVPTRVSGLADVAQIAVSSQRCALRRDGAVLCWGNNEFGQIGDGTKAPRTDPFVVLAGGAAQVVTGLGHTCARMIDGTAQCWGKSTHGELGAGSRTWRPRPGPVAGLKDVVELASTGEHTCARLADSTVRCWGANWSGQCGDGTRVERTLPVAVRDLRGVVQLAAGDEHSCAVTADGGLYCWGSNFAGQIEETRAPAAKDRPTPTKLLDGVAMVASGHMHSCAMLRDGSARCWGADMALIASRLGSNPARL